MIKIEKTEVWGWEAAIRGMRNPMNSWDKSDSGIIDIECQDCPNLITKNNQLVCRSLYGCVFDNEYQIGPNDLKLMKNLSNAGNDHGKFLRMINVTCDVIAPLYWWKELDQYKVGTVTNSCSTMHKIHAKEFTLDDFSHEHLDQDNYNLLKSIIANLNSYRNIYNNGGYIEYPDAGRKVFMPKDKNIWWQMIQLLPSSYNQRRTVQLNYQVLKTIYNARKDHKLDEWHSFCHWVEALPYFKEICLEKKKDRTRYFEFNYINIFGDTVTGYFKFPESVSQEKIEDNFRKWIAVDCVKSWYKEIIFNEGE